MLSPDVYFISTLYSQLFPEYLLLVPNICFHQGPAKNMALKPHMLTVSDTRNTIN